MVAIAVLDDYLDMARRLAPWESLPGAPDIRFYHDRAPSFETLARRLADVQIICTLRERTSITAALLDRLPELRLIAATGRVQASIDVATATARGILIATTGGTSSSTVELTWGLILALVRRIAAEDVALRAGNWQTTVGTGLEGKALGILGLGQIGSRVANVARAFGMRVLAWGLTLTQDRAVRHGAEMVTKDELLQQADIVTIHWRLSELTRGQIGAGELAMMKPTAYLVNTARGPIIDEGALVDALKAGRIAGAALDVYDREPLPADHPLLRVPNTVLTPHLGYASEDGLRAFYLQTIENIRHYLEGEPANLLNPEALDRAPDVLQ